MFFVPEKELPCEYAHTIAQFGLESTKLHTNTNLIETSLRKANLQTKIFRKVINILK